MKFSLSWDIHTSHWEFRPAALLLCLAVVAEMKPGAYRALLGQLSTCPWLHIVAPRGMGTLVLGCEACSRNEQRVTVWVCGALTEVQEVKGGQGFSQDIVVPGPLSLAWGSRAKGCWSGLGQVVARQTSLQSSAVYRPPFQPTLLGPYCCTRD